MRRKVLLPVLSSVVVLLFSFATASAQDAAGRMNEIVQSFVDAKQFMGAVLVARDEQILFNKAYGSANLEWNVANDSKTKFRLGSITKQFTATGILLLAERGKLKVDDPIKKYLPDAPAAWDKVTLYNLLTHTSGIKSFTSLPNYAQLEPFPITVDKTIAQIRDLPLEFAPGEKMVYSNSGYIILGAVIEKLSGVSYEKFIQENIFTPLGMKDSGYDSNSAIIAHRAAGYAPSPTGPVNAGFIHMSLPHGAGSLYSTTEDLLRWERGLFGGKIISKASLEQMTTPFKNDYAFGLVVTNKDGRKKIEHNGGIEGFNTSMAYYPQSKITVAVLANLNGPAADQIQSKLGQIAHGEAIQLTSERKQVALSSEALKQYVGTYALAPNVNMMVTLENSQLLGQLSGQRKLQLFGESEDKFFLKAVDAQIDFGRDSSGKVVSLVLHQNGRDRTAPRTSDTVLERKEIGVSREVLARYVGTYELRPGFDLVVTIENDVLMLQPTNQGKGRLFAESERSFFSKDVDAQIEFEVSGEGTVSNLVLHQGPMTARGQKK